MQFKRLKAFFKKPYMTLGIFGTLLVLPKQVFAVNAFIQLIGDTIWSFFMRPFVWLLELEFELLKYVARYNNFTHEGGVTLGWVALRDLSNMFFILVLLVIGFATILRISNYGYQQLLRRTIIIAILINFSKTIVGLFIDVAQVVMLTFVAAINEALTGGLVVAIGLPDIYTLNLNSNLAFEDYIVALVMGAILIAIFIVIIGVVLMMLVMRIVALWIAIILAPLAFFASIFPATKSFYDTWLKQLGTNLVTGPMLIFFLWLTLSIVGNGTAWKTFMPNEVQGSGPTEFLGTSNMVNYVVAIAMLLMGIRVAAKSGAAGANFAAKGDSMIKNKAGQLARRYPKAAASRIGGSIARRAVDEEGKPKDTLLGKFVKGSSKVPFYGGRIQRGFMKMQGRDAARIEAERAEDTKYINPRQRREFHRTQAALSDKPKEWRFGLGTLTEKVGLGDSKMLGKFGQKISSWGGGHDDNAVNMAKVMADRNDINSQEEATQVLDSLRRVDDEPRREKVLRQWANGFDSKEEAARLLNENSFASLMRDQKADAALDEDGNVTEGARHLIEAAFEDEDTVNYDIYKAILSKDKKGRVMWNKALEQVTGKNLDQLIVNEEDLSSDDEEKREAAKKNVVLETTKNESTGIEEVDFNEKSALQMKTDHAIVKATGGLMSYPQQAIASYNAMLKQMETLFRGNKIGFGEHAINNLKQRAVESDEHFAERKQKTKEEWDQATVDFESSGKTKDDVDKLYTTRRKLMGMYTNEEIDKEAPTLEKHIDETRQKWLNGDISEEEYRKQTEDERDKLRGMYASPLINVDGDKNDIDVATLVGSKLPTAPEHKKAEKAKVTEDEIDKLADRKMAAEGDLSKLSKADRTKLYDDKRKEAEKELTAKKDKEHKDQQSKYDSEYKVAMDEYNQNLAELPNKFREALKEIANDKDGKELKDIEVKIKEAKAKPQDDKTQKEIVNLLARQDTLSRVQDKKRRAALGLGVSTTRNHLNRAILKDATDGFDYARLQEMPIHEGPVKDLFQELARVATQDQQREMLNASNPNQIELFARTLVPTGQKMNKAIVDNLPVNLKNELFRLMHAIKYMREGLDETTARIKAENLPEKELSSVK